MEDNKFDDYLRKNIIVSLKSPIGEFSNILQKIEENKSLLEQFVDIVKNKKFWITAISSMAIACLMIIMIDSKSPIEDTLSINSKLYTEDLVVDISP